MKRFLVTSLILLAACTVGTEPENWVTVTPDASKNPSETPQEPPGESETPEAPDAVDTPIETLRTPDLTPTQRLTPTRICDQPEGCDQTPAPTSAFQGPVLRTFVSSKLRYLNVRSGPGLTFPVIDSYSPGVAVNCYVIESDWCQTDKGWVSVEFLELPE